MEDAATGLRDSFYTVVGLGVLGFQQVQLRRRDLQKELARLSVAVDAKVDPVLDELVSRLPDDVRPLATQARAAAVTARRALLGQPAPGR